MSLDRDQLLRLARLGAQARLSELHTEIASLTAQFPDLRREGTATARSRRLVKADGVNPTATHSIAGEAPARNGWTAEQRAAAAERMRAYWAKRRSAKGK